MPEEPLRQDEDAVERWKAMPQGRASRDALPPATGGLRWALWVIGGLGLLGLIALLLGG